MKRVTPLAKKRLQDSSRVPTVVVVLALALMGMTLAGAEDVARAAVISVLPFRTLAGPGYSFLGDSFSEALTTKLVGLKGVKIYERSQFERLAGELKLEKDASGLFDPASLARAGAVVSIDYVLLGSVTMGADEFVCQARLVHVNSSRALFSREFRGRYPNDVFNAQDRLSMAVVEALSLKLDELELKRITKKPTEDLDAYRLYDRSLAGGDASERIRLLEAALIRDPSFATARHLLADLLVEADKIKDAVRQYETILKTDPDDYRAVYNLGLLKLDVGDVGGARDCLDRCRVLKPGDADAAYHAGLAREFGLDGERYSAGSDLEAAVAAYAQAAALDSFHREARIAGGILMALAAQASTDPATRLGYLHASRDFLASWLKLAADDPQAPEIAANLELIEASIAEHEAWLKANGGG